ncbi:glycoside hydrolase family 2 TIM barrel-domain containing protein [Lentisphaera profundi]|uniref:Glycoside hydrolase family 2 TIM barrel-domain containing protein n=1 Tax=Lentisphaera profundi TaxID=1658616 RepID=A0ABY7VQ01_9BACT|nr:glycoside hydrolase family 2 TIM barrel-domain containing protein [Lentisphaera profundi]WDE95384.1 glycoside hydrolase family 2 TIM barrel-domain containing protein [Lentisphaera profundi]
MNLNLLISFFMISTLLSANPLQKLIDKVALKKGQLPTSPSKVELKKNEKGDWRLYINNVETAIRGAGGVIQPGMLEQFKLAGGNFTRTWGIGTLEDKVAGGERYIDRAWRLGIHVVPGLWIGHERHGVDYNNEEQLKKQRDHVRQSVRKWKNHPAIAMWGLGNEMEDPVKQTPNPAVIKELEILAKIIKEEDPHHPVMSVIAGSGAGKIKSIMQYYPSIDILGVNAYGSAAGTGEALKALGWTKPFAITEFGVQGFWEVPKTSWGAPIEPNSTEKSKTYYSSHKLVFDINEGKEMCLGTFAFLWGWKQEKTSTWFGMCLPTMEKLSQVDAMTKAWTGEWPENRCPNIKSISAEFDGKVIEAGRKYIARVDAFDRNEDSLTYEWVVTEEATVQSVGGDKEPVPKSHPNLILINNEKDCVMQSPSKPGAYRLFLTIRDGKGGAATANIPFKVK